MQKWLRKVQDAWMDCKAEEIQGYEEFLRIHQGSLWPSQQRDRAASQLRSNNVPGGEMAESEALSQSLQKRSQSTGPNLRHRHRSVPQVETNGDLDLSSFPSGTIKALQQLSSGNILGSCEIPVEDCKRGGPD
ncbi:hypothetical protein SprV_0100511300 [Sparganum proliferum]